MILLKLKAGALQFAMFILVVIALLLSAFIILIHTYKTFKVQTNFTLEAINNADKGIYYVMKNNLLLNDTILVDLKSEDYKSLKVYKSFWGVFEKAASVSKIKNKSFKKIALVGATQPESNRTSLYLEDHNKPLVLVGNTRIEGLAYIPKQGVRTGNISGHSYYGEHLIYGKPRLSDKLPRLNTSLINNIKKVDEKLLSIDEEQFLDLEQESNFKNSFYNPFKILYSPSQLKLEKISLTGHIIVQSKTKIIVAATSKLKDVILIAPKIEIKDYVEGNFQIFATNEIIVGKQCKLNYPSAIVLNRDDRASQSQKANRPNTFPIKINNSSEIRGVVIYLGKSKNYKAQVFLDKNSTILGELYCNQNVELLGNVYGSVFTSGFVANQNGSVYQNHIYNGVINNNKLPEEYIGLTFKNSNKGIAKWLY